MKSMTELAGGESCLPQWERLEEEEEEEEETSCSQWCASSYQPAERYLSNLYRAVFQATK